MATLILLNRVSSNLRGKLIARAVKIDISTYFYQVTRVNYDAVDTCTVIAYCSMSMIQGLQEYPSKTSKGGPTIASDDVVDTTNHDDDEIDQDSRI